MAAGGLGTAKAATPRGGGGGSREGLGRTHTERDELQGLSGTSRPPRGEVGPGAGPAGRGASGNGRGATAGGAGAGSVPRAGTGDRAGPPGETRTPGWAPTTTPQGRGAGGAGMLMTDTLRGPNMTPPQGGARDTSGKTLIPPDTGTGQGAEPGADPTGEARTPRQAPRERCPTTAPEGRGTGGAGILTGDELQGPSGTSRAPQGGAGTGTGAGAVPGAGTRSPEKGNATLRHSPGCPARLW